MRKLLKRAVVVLATATVALSMLEVPASAAVPKLPATSPGSASAVNTNRFGSRPATFGANTWDGGLLLERALPAALKAGKPGTEAFRSALRDSLEKERDVVGTQGVFNMSAANHNGMDERARVLVIVKDGKFRLLPE